MNRLEISTGAALVGVSVFSIHELYTKHAGSLHDMRQASPNAGDSAQRLIDADILAGGLTLLAAGALAFATGTFYPLLLGGLALLIVAWYYHAALASPAVVTGTDGES